MGKISKKEKKPLQKVDKDKALLLTRQLISKQVIQLKV